MYYTEHSIVINRPPADVFAVVSNVSRHKEWQDGVESSSWTSARPHGLGSTYLTIAQFAGSRWNLPGEVTV